MPAKGHKTSPVIRMLRKVNITPAGCWEFMGSRDHSDYGRAGDGNGKCVTTHRLMYQELCGEISEGLEVGHLCHNRPCCAPHHLKAMTHQENVAMSWREGRLGKLTKEQVLAIRADSRQHDRVAADFNISQSHVTRIKNRHIYANH